MAYNRRSYGSRRRANSGYSRGRATARRRTTARTRSTGRSGSRSVGRGKQEIVLRIEQVPASGISRMNERVLSKMNPPPGKAKL